jgi:hypothetical protein
VVLRGSHKPHCADSTSAPATNFNNSRVIQWQNSRLLIDIPWFDSTYGNQISTLNKCTGSSVDRAAGYELEGRGFKSLPVYQSQTWTGEMIKTKWYSNSTASYGKTVGVVYRTD